MYKNILILIVTGLGIAAITSASPTCAPPSCNVDIPIFGNDTSTPNGGIFTGAQSKPGLPATGSGSNLVPHVLSIGPNSFPSLDVTLYANTIKAGSLSLSNDSLTSMSTLQVGGNMTINKTSPPSSTDGILTITSLSSVSTANRPICIDPSKQVIVCP